MTPENFFGTVADILQHVKAMYILNKVPDIDCSWHFIVLYQGKIPIISIYARLP